MNSKKFVSLRIWIVVALPVIMTTGCAQRAKLYIAEPLRTERRLSVSRDLAWDSIVKTIMSNGYVIKSTDRSWGRLRFTRPVNKVEISQLCETAGFTKVKPKNVFQAYMDVSILLKSDLGQMTDMIIDGRCFALYLPPASTNALYSIAPFAFFAPRMAAFESWPVVYKSTGQAESDLYQQIMAKIDLDR